MLQAQKCVVAKRITSIRWIWAEPLARRCHARWSRANVEERTTNEKFNVSRLVTRSADAIVVTAGRAWMRFA